MENHRVPTSHFTDEDDPRLPKKRAIPPILLSFAGDSSPLRTLRDALRVILPHTLGAVADIAVLGLSVWGEDETRDIDIERKRRRIGIGAEVETR